MSNEDLKALIEEFGSRIFCICLNNNHKVFVNFTGDAQTAAGECHLPLTSDFKYKTTKGGDDMFGVPHVKESWGRKKIAYTSWIRTALVEIIMTLDDPDCMDIPDLNHIL